MLGRPVRADSADRMHGGVHGRATDDHRAPGPIVGGWKPSGDCVARALVGRLLDYVRREGFVTVRLESLRFMTAAHALYRSQGFMETPPFAGSEAGSAGLESGAVFMELVQRYVLTRLVAVIGAHG